MTVHHWGQARIEGLLRDDCPALFARYYQHDAKPSLRGYDGHDFKKFATDYRKKAAIAHRRLRTIGLPPETLREHDATTEIPLRKVFVPQRFLPEEDRERLVTLAELLKADQSCVLLGDPGMGKTTVLSFLALLLSGEAELPDFSPAAQVIPLLVPLRDFLKLKQERTDLDFLGYLTDRAHSDLNLPHAHRAFFEATLRMGEAVVLMDGLDEAGGDASRSRISTAVQTFKAEFPDCPCWVTSRVYGYAHDVRLPSDVFAHYAVGRLGPAQIDEFVDRWYEIQYPDNPREREERVESLQHALRRSPSVQGLAGNPLLLTLMAFIHRGQRSLPQDRGELYERCIQMLLMSWQEAKQEGGSSAKDQAGQHPFEKIGLHVATQKDYLAHLAMAAQQLNEAADKDEGRGIICRADALDCLSKRHLERSRRTRPGLEPAEAREEMEQFLDYISDRSGLLIDKGGGQLSFLHLSFQEYLAAWLYMCHTVDANSERDFFDSHLGQPAWEEVLLLRLYIILRQPGGGGEHLFDAVISGLLRKLERKSAAEGWLTLARAVRDNLEFSAGDRNTILQKAIDFWMESPPRFDGNWFNVLEETCLFAPHAKEELGGLLEPVWRHAQLSRAVACLHLMQRLGCSEGKTRIDQRPEFAQEIRDLMLERGPQPDWRNTLSFAFECLIGERGAEVGIERLQDLARCTELPAIEANKRGQTADVWRMAIVVGDWLKILAASGAPIPDDLISFFRSCVFQAIEQEIAVEERQTLAVSLGRLGDPRVAKDLRISTHPDDHPGYVKIPADDYFVSDEKKPITIDKTYWLSKYPVTNSQYALFVDDNGYLRQELWSDEGWLWIQREGLKAPDYWRHPQFNAPNQPVVAVSWWEADAFCRWAGVRLPGADEAEAAARGPQGFAYPWGDDWEDGICNSDEAGLGGTSAVGIFPRDQSPFGVMDMAGNVWEWCADSEAALRVFRGGSWAGGARLCRAAGRIRLEPQYRDDDLGFRVAAVPLAKSRRE